MKAFTDISQSRKLAEILPLESADTIWDLTNPDLPTIRAIPYEDSDYNNKYLNIIPAWSLAALLEYMNRNFYNISLNYCGSEYTISFDDSEKYKTITKDYSIDAVFEMVIWLKENNML